MNALLGDPKPESPWLIRGLIGILFLIVGFFAETLVRSQIEKGRQTDQNTERIRELERRVGAMETGK